MKKIKPVKATHIISQASIRRLSTSEKPEAILRNGGETISSSELIERGYFTSKWQLYRSKKAIAAGRSIRKNGRPLGLNSEQENYISVWINLLIHDEANPKYPTLEEIGAKVTLLLFIINKEYFKSVFK